MSSTAIIYVWVSKEGELNGECWGLIDLVRGVGDRDLFIEQRGHFGRQ